MHLTILNCSVLYAMNIFGIRVIVIVLTLLIIIPLLQSSEDDITYHDASSLLHMMNVQSISNSNGDYIVSCWLSINLSHP